MDIKKFNSYITESIDVEKLEDKVSEKYRDLYVDITELAIETIRETKTEGKETLADLKKLLSDYVAQGKGASSIDGLIDDNDVFNFYIKHQSSIDEILNESGYMDKPPVENNVYGLYDIVIDGTQDAILRSVKRLVKQLF